MADALPFADLHIRHHGLTPTVAGCYEEAARVCLDRHHTSPSSILIRAEGGNHEAALIWEATDARARAAWANDLDATRDGAYALVIAAVELASNLYAIRRAEHATGADYYVAPIGTELDDLEECLRLEVSGTDGGAQADLERRLRAKIEQARKGKSNLPALAGVVGYQLRLILMARVENMESQ